MPTANAEGQSESEGSVGKVSVSRILRYPQVDTGPRRSPSACAEILEKKTRSAEIQDFPLNIPSSVVRMPTDMSEHTPTRTSAHASPRMSTHISQLRTRLRTCPHTCLRACRQTCLHACPHPCSHPCLRTCQARVDLRQIYFWRLFRRIPTANAEG